MRKIIVLSFVLSFLVSCSLSKKETDFTALYNNYVVASVSQLDDLAETIGYKNHESIEGTIKAGLQIPVLMSGAFTSGYDIKINNSDTSGIFSDMKLNFETPINSGSLTAKKLGMTSITGDLYLLMEDFVDSGIFPPEAHAIFARYNNKWLSYTQKDMENSLSGSTEEDILVSTIAQNISKMGTKDIEKYLTGYPIWKSTTDLGMSGSLHRFAIELDQEGVMNLVKKVTLDISGSGMTKEREADIRTNLKALSFSGVLAFDPSDTQSVDLDVELSQSGNLVANMVFTTSVSHTYFKLSSVADTTDIVFSLTKSDKRTDMKLTLTQDGTEAGQLVGYIVRDEESVREVSLDLSAQGTSVSLKHTIKEDGNFDGKLALPVGMVTWNGKINKKKLESLVLKGTTPMGSIDMSLLPEGGVLRGPLVVKTGGIEILRANIGLRMDEGVSGLDVAVLNPEGGEPTLKANVEVTHTTKDFNDAILPPSVTEPLQNMLDELDKIVPRDVYSDELPIEDIESIQTDLGDLDTPSIQ